MNSVLNAVRDGVRAVMRVIARGLNTLTGGHLSPNVVTIFGLLAHLPIAYLLAYGKLELAAVLLVVFGLFDTLDGELARLQKRTSGVGMLLDSVTDRMKEIIIYGGITFYLVSENQAYFAVWAILALGGSVLTSYLNAWGEVVVSKHGSATNSEVNKSFRGGILSFEVRMFLIVVALLADKLPILVMVVAVLSWLTAIQRIFMITKRLK